MISITKKLRTGYNKLKRAKRIKKEERINKSDMKISELIKKRVIEISKECNNECVNDKEKYRMARTKLEKYLKELYADENTIDQITRRKIYLTKESKDIESTMAGIFGGLILSIIMSFYLDFNDKVINAAMDIGKEINDPIRAIFTNLIFVGPFAILGIIIFFSIFTIFIKLKKDMYRPQLYEKLDIERYELLLIEESYKKVYGECN